MCWQILKMLVIHLSDDGAIQLSSSHQKFKRSCLYTKEDKTLDRVVPTQKQTNHPSTNEQTQQYLYIN